MGYWPPQIAQPGHEPAAKAHPTRARPQRAESAASAAVAAPAKLILRLQAHAGNSAVTALIGGRRSLPAPTSSTPNLLTIARSPASDAIAAIDNVAGPDVKGAFDKL